MASVGGAGQQLLFERPAGPAAVVACCSAVYGHPLAEAMVGESFHPGGLSRTRELLGAASLPRGASVLDVGCGLGASARVAAADFGFAVDAVDVSEVVLDGARARSTNASVTWQRGDVTALPAADEAYDAVLAECLLAAAPRKQAMAEIARVLRPRGVLLVSDVTISGEAIEGFEAGGVLGTALCVSSAWLPGEFDSRIDAAGLEVVRRWDHSEDILRLVERIEGRLVVARSMLSADAVTGAGAGTASMPDAAAVRTLAAAVRDAVADGRLGYFAAIARLRA